MKLWLILVVMWSAGRWLTEHQRLHGNGCDLADKLLFKKVNVYKYFGLIKHKNENECKEVIKDFPLDGLNVSCQTFIC